MLKPHLMCIQASCELLEYCWRLHPRTGRTGRTQEGEWGYQKMHLGNMQKLGILILDHPKKNGLYIVTYTGILGSFSPDESSKFWQIPSGND